MRLPIISSKSRAMRVQKDDMHFRENAVHRHGSRPWSYSRRRNDRVAVYGDRSSAAAGTTRVLNLLAYIDGESRRDDSTARSRGRDSLQPGAGDFWDWRRSLGRTGPCRDLSGRAARTRALGAEYEGQDRGRRIISSGGDDGKSQKNLASPAWLSAGFMIRIFARCWATTWASPSQGRSRWDSR